MLRVQASPRTLPIVASLLGLLLLACSADGGDDGIDAGTGGSGGSGGVVGSGGATNTGGAVGTGGATTGGAATTGGTGGTGGQGTGGVVETCTPSSGTEDVGSSSFLDKATCLTWQKSSTASSPITNRAALAYCNGLSQDGFDDWRLPTAQELRSYPGLAESGNAYLAGPTYIPSGASSEMAGCTDNSHSCNLTQYSAGNFACAWQGPGAGAYPVLCVRGTAGVALDAAFVVATCCAGSSTYVEADCSAYP